MKIVLRAITAMLLSCVIVTGCTKIDKKNDTSEFSTYTNHEFSRPAYIMPPLYSDDAEFYFNGIDVEKDDYVLWFHLHTYAGKHAALDVWNVSVNNIGCEYTFEENVEDDGAKGEYVMRIAKKEVEKSSYKLPYLVSFTVSFNNENDVTVAYADASIRPFGYIIPAHLPVPISANEEQIYFDSNDYCIEFGGITCAAWDDGGYSMAFRLNNKTDKDVIFRIIMQTENGMEGFEFYTAAHSYHPHAGIPIGWSGIDYDENPFEFRVEIVDPDKKEIIQTIDGAQKYGMD